MKLTEKDVKIPAGVPHDKHKTYVENFLEMTNHSGRLNLFAGDQKIEHLNDDFFGEGISEEDADPEHLFRIAAEAKIGVFAAQLGLISLYGRDYPQVDYLVKLNSKSHLVMTKQKDPISKALLTVQQVVDFAKDSKLKIRAVGYTIYTGSEFESEMFTEASQIIHEAHKHGLCTVIWSYPRGQAVLDEKDPHIIAGAAGVTAVLGADFAKVNYPKADGKESAEIFKEAINAAGRTRIITSGGGSIDPEKFLKRLHDQIHISGAFGAATGRNIHQKSHAEAVRLANACHAIIVEDASVEDAVKILKS
ncbi:MAG: aldolase [Nanoarchaeota archaeon]